LTHAFDRFAAASSRFAGRPWAFLIAVGLIVVWLASGPFFAWSDTWQLVINTGTTIVTFLMCFLIQATQNRDAAAVGVKLDGIIRALDKAPNDLIGVERRSGDEIEALREEPL
jgi:low affinity Fe/Cu permease